MMRMFTYVCQSCRTIWRVVGDTTELGGLSLVVGNDPACIRPRCSGHMALTAQLPSGLFRQEELPVANFFRAALGFCAPDGKAASLATFKYLLTSKKVSKVEAYSTGTPERVILKSLELEDGTRLHFETSAKGACCFYIENAGPSCLEVVDGEISGEKRAGLDSVCEDRHQVFSQNREEARRTAALADESIFPEFDFDGKEPSTVELPSAECVPSVPAPC